MFSDDKVRRILYLKRIGDYLGALGESEKLIIEGNTDNWIIRQVAYLYYYFENWNGIEKLINSIDVNDPTSSNLKEELKLLKPSLVDNKTDDEYIIKGINLVPQVGNGCVPASCAMIINYWESTQVRGRDISKELDCDLRDSGTSTYNIVPFLISKGYQVFPFVGKCNVVSRLIKMGLPILSIQKSDMFSITEHAKIVVGYNYGKSLFYTLDPLEGKSFIPFKIYERLGNERGKSLHILACPSKIIIDDWFKDYFTNDEVHCNFMGCAYDDLNIFEKAEEYFKKGISIDANYADLLNNYASLLLKDNSRLKEAYDLCKKAIKYSNEIPEYYETLKVIEEKGESINYNVCG